MRFQNFTTTLIVSCLAVSCSKADVETPIEAHVTAQEKSPKWDPWAVSNPHWVRNIPPHKILGNVYSVGTAGLACFLITTDEGHILIDGGLPNHEAVIVENIKTLGFDIRDVRYLLNSHAHFDHSGGLAKLKEMSGAKMVASQGDLSALEGGFYLGFEENKRLAAPPVKVDQIIQDGEELQLGSTVLIANITPGHSRGCTSWSMTITETEIDYKTLFFCSATVAGNSLNPPQYEGMIEDYRSTFETLKTWQPDIFLANHPGFFKLKQKRQAQLNGDELAFVDKVSFPKLALRLQRDFEKSLAEAYQDLKAE